ncbi:MAG: DUF4351 domain-containing protein [Magnetococcus sp. MYC-9]
MIDATHTADSIYHRLFSHPEMVADLLQNFLDPELLAAGLERLQVPDPILSIPEELEEVVNMLATHVEKWSRAIKQEGRQEGLCDGEVRTLLRQMHRRFGPVPDWAQARIANASVDLLDAWADKILDANTLESVFQEV